MKFWFFIFGLVLWIPALGLSQTTYEVNGLVVDETGTPLTGAHVLLSPDEVIETTDENGQFTFESLKESTYSIDISYIGFQSISRDIVVDRDIYLKIELIPGQILTDEIVVQGIRANVNTGTTYENLDREEIQRKNTGQDLPFLLQMTPSVVVTSDAGHGVGYTGIRIRGSDATRINATINGIPYNDAESQGTFWVNLPDFASSVESIQVQRGVGTSTNGSGAFGASLNINTNTLNAQPYIHLNNSVGSFNTWKNTVALGSGLIDDHFVLDARLSRISSDGFIDRAFSDLKSLYLSGGWYGDRSILRFNLITGKEKTYQAWNGIPEDILKTNRTYNEFTYPDQTDNYTQTHYQLHFSNQVAPDFNWSISGNYTRGAGYYEEYKEDQDFGDYGLKTIRIGDSIIESTNLVRRRWLDNHFYGLTGHANWSPAESLDFTLGGAFYQYIGDHYGEVIWAEYTSDSFIDDRYYFNDALKNDGNTFLKTTWSNDHLAVFMDLQARFLYYSFLGIDRFGESLEQDDVLAFFNPKIGFTYHVGQDSQWYGSLAKGSREPNRDDYTEGPENLRPKAEELYDLEAGYRFNSTTHRFSANLYYMKYINQLVLNGEINDVGTYIRTNVRDSYRLGVEISEQYAFNHQWQVGGNIALSINRIPEFSQFLDVYDEAFNFVGQQETVHENTTIAFSPSVVGHAQITYYPVDALSLTWESKYVSRQYMDNTTNIERSIDPYFFNNLRVAFDKSMFGLKNLRLALDLKNLFNTSYETNGYTFGYIYDGRRSDFNYYYPQAGFHFMFSLNINI